LEAKRGVGRGREDIETGFKKALLKCMSYQLAGEREGSRKLDSTRKGDA